MKTIVFFADLQEGHSLAACVVARALRCAGFDVCFVGPVDMQLLIERQGFPFHAVLTDVLPYGVKGAWNGVLGLREMCFSWVVSGRALDSVFRELRPQAAVVFSYQCPEALAIRRLYGIPVILLSPYMNEFPRPQQCMNNLSFLTRIQSGVSQFRDLLKISSHPSWIEAIAETVLSLPELALYPRCIQLSGWPEERNMLYLGVTIDRSRNDCEFDWSQVDQTRRLVYCSLGTQSHRRAAVSVNIYRAVVKLAAIWTEMQFVISFAGLEFRDLGEISKNVYLCDWVPQLDVISRASLTICHGGLGTVKESIMGGVPMIVIPLAGDQRPVSIRIVHHGLGICLDSVHASAERLAESGREILGSESIRARVRAMRASFLLEENLASGVNAIKQFVC